MGASSSWFRRYPAAASSGLILGATTALAVVLWYAFSGEWSPVPWFVAWLASINLTTFCAYGFDKRRAMRDERRVPELSLLLISFLGGSAGALAAMQLFRHKTVKGSFRIGFWLIVALQVAFGAWAAKLIWFD